MIAFNYQIHLQRSRDYFQTSNGILKARDLRSKLNVQKFCFSRSELAFQLNKFLSNGQFLQVGFTMYVLPYEIKLIKLQRKLIFLKLCRKGRTQLMS